MPEKPLEEIAADWIKEHGEDAPERARRRAASIGRGGDTAQAEKLRQIASAADRLLTAAHRRAPKSAP